MRSPVVNNFDLLTGQSLCKVSNLSSPDSTWHVHAAGIRFIVEGAYRDVVRYLAEKVTAPANQVQMRLKLRSIDVAQNVDELPLAAAAGQRPDREQDSDSIGHGT